MTETCEKCGLQFEEQGMLLRHIQEKHKREVDKKALKQALAEYEQRSRGTGTPRLDL